MPLSERDKLHARFGHELGAGRGRNGADGRGRPGVRPRSLPEGQADPGFFGSAVNNFGVQEVLDALVDLAPPPRPRFSTEKDGSRKEDPA